MECISDGIFYYLLFNIVYYVSNLFLFIIDMMSVTSEYKLQPKSVDEILATYKKCLPVVLTNTLVLSLPTVLTLPLFVNLGGFDFSWAKMIFDLCMSYVLTDIFFYASHRLLHTEYLYGRFHKKHHEIIAPVGLSATYLTPVDFYSNILSIYLPPLILSSHSITISVLIVSSTLNTVLIGHSGYDPLAKFHDDHHKYFNCNYGLGLFVDKIFRTDRTDRTNRP